MSFLAQRENVMTASTYSARTPAEYIQTRVDYKTEAYRRKGEHYRFGYQTTATLAAVAAATVPVLINFKDVPPIVPTLLSLLVTILVTLEGIFHFREHWKSYDLMKSFLRQEACLFEAGAGAYRGKGANEAFVLLVERVEDAIAKERAQTIEMRTSRAPEEQEKGGGAQTKTPPPAPTQGASQGPVI
jgi:hypothetical protein